MRRAPQAAAKAPAEVGVGHGPRTAACWSLHCLRSGRSALGHSSTAVGSVAFNGQRPALSSRATRLRLLHFLTVEATPRLEAPVKIGSDFELLVRYGHCRDHTDTSRSLKWQCKSEAGSIRSESNHHEPSISNSNLRVVATLSRQSVTSSSNLRRSFDGRTSLRQDGSISSNLTCSTRKVTLPTSMLQCHYFEILTQVSQASFSALLAAG